MLQYKVNRLETTKLIGPLINKHWEEIRHAHERGKKVVWLAGPLFHLTRAMDIPAHEMPAYAAWVGGKHHASQLIEIAEADGFMPEACSYHKVHMGLLAAIRDGIPIPDEAQLSIPDMMLSAPFCPEMPHLSDSLHRRYGVPIVTLNFSTPHSEADMEIKVKYVEREVREVAIPALETLCGYPFSYDRLSEVLAILKKAATIRNECWEFFKRIPSPWTLWDYVVSMAPFVLLAGEPEGVAYYEKLKAELEQRVSQGVTALVPEEKYRILWDGLAMYGWLGVMARKFVNFGANPICGRYPWEMTPHPEWINPDDPLRSYAELIVRQGMINNSPEFLPAIMANLIEEYSIDGIVALSSKTCRNWNMGQEVTLAEMERRYGIPGVIIDADMIDPKFFSEAQIDTRLQALFELIDARKQKKKVV